MKRFECNETYKNDLKEYNENIFDHYGFSSQSAEREIMYMSVRGNTVASKLYGDMIFYKKIAKKNPYREAFNLYMKSSGLFVSENGVIKCSGNSYPLAFWLVGYYLMDYRRESFLKNCEVIDVIEEMSLFDRLSTALELAAACVEYTGAAGAVNLIGRIIYEASENQGLFISLKPVIEYTVAGKTFSNISLEVPACNDISDCAQIAESFFGAAADAGYVYACNNLAAKEADRIISLTKNGGNEEEIKDSVGKYISFLTLSAEKYEPYAANRLGLMYVSGEIKGSAESIEKPELKDSRLAKEYFMKASVYPDKNSAWAYFNLLKYFYRDYATDIDVLNEFMEKIRELNPDVYDLAMEL